MTDTQEEKTHKVEIALVKLDANLTNLTSSVEDGIAKKLTYISQTLSDYVLPHVKENTYWVGKIKMGVIQLAILGLAGTIVLVVIWFLNGRPIGS